VFLLWVVVLAIVLLCSKKSGADHSLGERSTHGAVSF
jgi:hypothetical protein